MLKSLFESSIDKLNIPADMKDAIKQINNVCLEAEEKDDGKEKDLGYTPMSDEDKKKAKKIKDDKKKKEIENSREKDPASEKEDVAATHNFDYKTHNYNVFPNPAEQDKKPANAETKEKEASKEDKEDKGTKVEKGATREPEQVRTDGAQVNPNETNQKEDSNEGNEDKGTTVAKGATREPEQVRTDGAQVNPNETPKAAPEAAPKAAPKYRADVATVQYFLQATEPNKKIAADGILGPQTIGVIQETEGRKKTGKMDEETQEVFNKLLNKAKEKVKAVQAKLGVTQDGLIGKQTLAALQKANMQVASVFSDNPQVPANTQPAQQQAAQPQQAQPQQQAQNVTSIKFNEAQAQQFLKNRIISQQEYNIWKQYGIAPKFQRQNPQGTQNQIAAMQQKQKEVNTGTNVQKGGQQTNAGTNVQQGGQQTALTTNGPRNEAEKKFFDQTKQNYITIYSADKKTPKSMIVEKADQAARVALAKMQKGEWAKEGQAALNKVIANMGNNNQTQNAAQPQQAQPQQQAQKGMTREPSQVRTSGAAPQQQAAQPQQQAQQQQAPQQQQAQPQQQAQQQQQNPKQPNGSTQYLSGKISYMNLPPDEKKVYDDTEKKAMAEYIKKGNNEQTAYDKAQMNAQVAVLQYRKKKGKKA